MFDALEPFGERRLDFATAQLLAMMANVNRDPKVRPEPFTPADFLPAWTAADREAMESRQQDALTQKLEAAFR